MILYHVTHQGNVKSILEHGLLPATGFLADVAWETRDAVYFFKELDEEFQKDINGWMTMGCPREKQVLLKVDLPEDFGLYGGLKERWDWEMVCYKQVPAKYIEVIPFP